MVRGFSKLSENQRVELKIKTDKSEVDNVLQTIRTMLNFIDGLEYPHSNFGARILRHALRDMVIYCDSIHNQDNSINLILHVRFGDKD